MTSTATKITLTKPIKAHNDEVTELTFRPMTGEDLIEIGAAPFQVDQKERTHMDFGILALYIARLANIPPSSVKMMAPADLLQSFGVVSGFFGDTGPTQKK